MSCIAFASSYAKCMMVSMCVIQCHVHTTCIVDEHNNFCILDKEKEDIVDKLKSILAQLEYTRGGSRGSSFGSYEPPFYQDAY